MLAEIHGKADPESSLPVARSEDLLTDAVFGTLRHLDPRHGLGPVLADLGLTFTPSDLDRVQILMWPQIPMPRWPGKVIEPDVVVIIGRQVVVFEAKLYSPFGSYPNPDAPGTPELHQLAVQHAAVRDWAAGQRLQDPVMVAVTADLTRPQSLDQATRDMAILSGNGLHRAHWLPWQRIAGLMQEQRGLRPHEARHVQDVLELMDRRGVRRVFEPIPMEEYWLVTAAQRVAIDRLYPRIRTFFDELTAVLAEDDISWSQPSYKGMWLGGSSTSVSKPADWSRSFVGAQYWPTLWPNRNKVGLGLSLYVVFDFLEPGVEVGLSIPGPGSAAAQQSWTPHLADLANELQHADGCELALDSGDLARPTRTTPAIDVDAPWLANAPAVMVSTAHLRLRKRLPVATLTVQETRSTVHEIRAQTEALPSLWAMLRASGHVEQPSQ